MNEQQGNEKNEYGQEAITREGNLLEFWKPLSSFVHETYGDHRLVSINPNMISVVEPVSERLTDIHTTQWHVVVDHAYDDVMEAIKAYFKS